MKNQSIEQHGGLLSRISEQFGITSMVSTYLIPEDTNNFWYSIGGILGIALAMQFVTGFILMFKYVPDAALAYGITKGMIESPTWRVILNFHYFNSFVVFALLFAHIMRVFISGAYRGKRKGLWFVGILLGGLLFGIYTTGEALHWDEVGFAVPWHTSEVLQAIGMEKYFGYDFHDLLAIPSATVKLTQVYAIHISLASIILALLMVLHFYLIREKKITQPYWMTPSGKEAPFSKHIKIWFIWSGIILGVIILVSAFVPRDPGVAPQLLPTSPYFGMHAGPGKLGAKPTWPISWTHGLNVFVGEHLGLEPDIWGTVIGVVMLFVSLALIPYVDPGENAPKNFKEVFDFKKRGYAYLAMSIFWLVFLVGVIQNMLAGAG
ncbi:MAG: cytochrome b N-terminal domain-containing protein [Desulfocapsaceae bacterium]|nr:cytochrome b N-terminal domain-containing protein [Desulfocapsaceae bacterium]